MSLTAFGGKPKTIFINEIESHKIHLAFEVADATTVKRGQPLKLNASGQVVALAEDGSDAHLIAGYSIHNGVAGDMVTLGMTGFAVVYAKAKTALNPGAVFYAGQDATDDDYTSYDDTAVTAANMNGLALDIAGTAGDIIRVLLK